MGRFPTGGSKVNRIEKGISEVGMSMYALGIREEHSFSLINKGVRVTTTHRLQCMYYRQYFVFAYVKKIPTSAPT